MFFLDAHISSYDSSYNPKYPVPLLEELKIINSKKLGSSLFIIDDVRLWKSGEWQNLSNTLIYDLFHPKQIIKTYEYNDRLWIFTTTSYLFNKENILLK